MATNPNGAEIKNIAQRKRRAKAKVRNAQLYLSFELGKLSDLSCPQFHNNIKCHLDNSKDFNFELSFPVDAES